MEGGKFDIGIGGGNVSAPVVCVKHWKSFYIRRRSVKLYWTCIPPYISSILPLGLCCSRCAPVYAHNRKFTT